MRSARRDDWLTPSPTRHSYANVALLLLLGVHRDNFRVGDVHVEEVDLTAEEEPETKKPRIKVEGVGCGEVWDLT
jgi:hypothetical protein